MFTFVVLQPVKLAPGVKPEDVLGPESECLFGQSWDYSHRSLKGLRGPSWHVVKFPRGLPPPSSGAKRSQKQLVWVDVLESDPSGVGSQWGVWGGIEKSKTERYSLEMKQVWSKSLLLWVHPDDIGSCRGLVFK